MRASFVDRCLCRNRALYSTPLRGALVLRLWKLPNPKAFESGILAGASRFLNQSAALISPNIGRAEAAPIGVSAARLIDR